MTKKFDDKARNELIKNYTQIKYDGTPVSKMIIKEITCKEARKYISTFHYSFTFPDSTKFCYAGYLNNILCGIICYGMGCGKAQYTSVIPYIQNGEYLELTRLWCVNDMPKNTESKLISQSLKMLPKQYKLIISFSDSSEGHCGIIYQATNWYYLGKNKGGKMLITKDGIKKHPRLIGIYRKRHPELKNKDSKYIMDLYEFKTVEGGIKHRYVFLRGNKKEKKEMFKYIENRIEKYPKCNKKESISEVSIINKFNLRD